MSKYKLIIEYYQKGNNNSQIATLCSCSRTIVWTVLKRIKALRWKSFIILYNAYRKPKIVVEDSNDKIRNKLKDFNFLLSCCPCGSINYEVIKIQKEEWLKSLKLEEDKILDEDKE